MTAERIALLLDSAPRTWTSQEDRHLRLCQTLSRRGIHPVLVFSSELAPEIGGRLREGGAEIEAISYSRGAHHYYRELGALVRKYSVTTAHVIFFDYFSAVPWLARLQGVKHIVYEMQNSGIFTATSWKRKLLHLRNQLAAMPMTRVIAISEFVKEQLVRGGIAEGQIVVRYLGVDPVRFSPDAGARADWANHYGVGPEELILSFVAYLRPFKNPQVAVEACGLLAARGVPARLFVAGGGEMLGDMKELSRKLGIADRTHWLGDVPDPRRLLQASDLFLLTSVGEAFGLVLAEAMACGAPVVGSRSGAIGEVVEDGRTGLLAAPLDPASFAGAIAQLAADGELRRSMGRAAVERVRQKFTVDLAVENTLRIYDSMWGH